MAELVTTLCANILQPVQITGSHSQLEFVLCEKGRVSLNIDFPSCIEDCCPWARSASTFCQLSWADGLDFFDKKVSIDW